MNCHIIVAKCDVRPRTFDMFTLNLKKCVNDFISILHRCCHVCFGVLFYVLVFMSYFVI